MTPFDPDTLQAMLTVFYPRASAAALRVARIERPEYFAGGQLVGHGGDELALGDGRRFRCIDYAGSCAVGWKVRAWPTTSPSSPAH